MKYEQITVATANNVSTITLNRADKLNAWTQRMESEFRQAIQAAESDTNVRAIVVTGAAAASVLAPTCLAGRPVRTGRTPKG